MSWFITTTFSLFAYTYASQYLLIRTHTSGPEQEMIAAILVTVSEEYVRIAVKAVNSLAK